MNPIARLHICLDAHEDHSSPKHDLETVEDHVRFETEPLVVFLGEDLVGDYDK